jgi:hypothetical protein
VKMRSPNKEVIEEATFRSLYRYLIKSQVHCRLFGMDDFVQG